MQSRGLTLAGWIGNASIRRCAVCRKPCDAGTPGYWRLCWACFLHGTESAEAARHLSLPLPDLLVRRTALPEQPCTRISTGTSASFRQGIQGALTVLPPADARASAPAYRHRRRSPLHNSIFIDPAGKAVPPSWSRRKWA